MNISLHIPALALCLGLFGAFVPTPRPSHLTSLKPVNDFICARTPEGANINDVTLDYVSNSNPALPPMNTFVGTVFDHCTVLGNIIPISTSTKINLSKKNDPLNGVSTYDLLLISKHILGVQPIVSPYKMLAADVNKSGSITTYDIVELRKLILGRYTELPGNDSWRFVNAGFTFPNPQNPFATIIPEEYSYNDLVTMGNVFYGIKIGDVNGNAIPLDGASDDRSTLQLRMDDAWLQAGQSYILPIKIGEKTTLEGLQLALGFDPQQISIEKTTAGALTNFSENDVAQPSKGIWNASWIAEKGVEMAADDAIIYLKIKALASVQLSKALWLSNERFRPEAYNAETQIMPLTLDLRASQGAISAATITAPQPNPTEGAATFSVNLNGTTAVSWEILDFSGKVLSKQNALFPAGQHTVILPAEATPTAGTYTLRVQAGKDIRTSKLVRM